MNDPSHSLATCFLEVSRFCAAAPEFDLCSVDEIIGYAANGLPT